MALSHNRDKIVTYLLTFSGGKGTLFRDAKL